MDVRSVILAVASAAAHGERVLVGLSGGVDSVVLLRTLAAWGGRNLAAAHLNHQLRGIDSERDAAFARELAESCGVPFLEESRDVAAYAKKHRLGIEAAARRLRQDFLERARAETGSSWLAVGHHADDRAETVLYNFLRGSGLRGMSAMRPRCDERRLIRPLLTCRRKEIVTYAQANGWDWREDLTNGDTDFDRNWLRHEIIPELEARRRGTVKVLLRTAERFEEIESYLSEEAEKWLAKERSLLEDPAECFDLQRFNELHNLMKVEVLSKIWEEVHGARDGLDAKKIEMMLGWLRTGRANTQVYFGPDAEMANAAGMVKLRHPALEAEARISLGG